MQQRCLGRLLVLPLAVIGCITGAIAQDRGVAGTWVLQSIDAKAPFAQRDLVLTLGGGSISGLLGCNDFAGSYELSDERIYPKDLSTTTDQVCASFVLMQEERHYFELLATVVRYEFTQDNGLVLVTRAGNEIRYRRASK